MTVNILKFGEFPDTKEFEGIDNILDQLCTKDVKMVIQDQLPLVTKSLKEASATLVVAHLQNKDQLMGVINLMKKVKPFAKSGKIKTIVIDEIGNSEIETLLLKLGAQEVLSSGVALKPLSYKLKFLLKSLSSMAKKEEAENKIKKPKGAASNQSNNQVDTKKGEVKIKPALMTQDDTWIINLPGHVKNLLGRWSVKFVGPSPFVGQWNKLQKQDRTWRFDFKDHIKDRFIQGEGAWYFKGDQKPEFIWKENVWLVSGKKVQLFYHHDEESYIRFRTNAKIAEVTENSEAALSKKKAIEESFEQEVLVKKEQENESSTEINEDNVKDLHGKSKTNSTSNRLSGKSDTDSFDDELSGFHDQEGTKDSSSKESPEIANTLAKQKRDSQISLLDQASEAAYSSKKDDHHEEKDKELVHKQKPQVSAPKINQEKLDAQELGLTEQRESLTTVDEITDEDLESEGFGDNSSFRDDGVEGEEFASKKEQKQKEKGKNRAHLSTITDTVDENDPDSTEKKIALIGQEVQLEKDSGIGPSDNDQQGDTGSFQDQSQVSAKRSEIEEVEDLVNQEGESHPSSSEHTPSKLEKKMKHFDGLLPDGTQGDEEPIEDELEAAYDVEEDEDDKFEDTTIINENATITSKLVPLADENIIIPCTFEDYFDDTLYLKCRGGKILKGETYEVTLVVDYLGEYVKAHGEVVCDEIHDNEEDNFVDVVLTISSKGITDLDDFLEKLQMRQTHAMNFLKAAQGL